MVVLQVLQLQQAQDHPVLLLGLQHPLELLDVIVEPVSNLLVLDLLDFLGVVPVTVRPTHKTNCLRAEHLLAGIRKSSGSVSQEKSGALNGYNIHAEKTHKQILKQCSGDKVLADQQNLRSYR